MKICYIAPDVEIPNYRGASTHVLELSKALTGLGHRVHVISRRSPSLPEVEEIAGVTLHRIYRGIIGPIPMSGYEASDSPAEELGGLYARTYRVYLETAYALYAAYVASRVIVSFGLDVIIERETAFGAGAIASKMCHRPMVLEMIGPRFSPLSMRRCSSLLAYNEQMVPKSSLEKSVFVRAAVNMDLFRPDSQARKKMRGQINLDGSVVVGYIGSFLTWHGIDDLLDAALIVRRTSSHVKFLMVGPHSDKLTSSVEQRGLDDITNLVGPVPYEQVPSYINACDIVVAPYNILRSTRRGKGIGSPLKVLEYMACGKATVGSDLPQVADLVEDGKTGLLFPQGDAESLARSVLKLVEDPSYRERLGARALESVRANYSWFALAAQISSMLGQILERPA